MTLLQIEYLFGFPPYFSLGPSYTLGSPTDIGHSSIYCNFQGSLVDRGVWGGGILEK